MAGVLRQIHVGNCAAEVIATVQGVSPFEGDGGFDMLHQVVCNTKAAHQAVTIKRI
jgi:hypothetical protein